MLLVGVLGVPRWIALGSVKTLWIRGLRELGTRPNTLQPYIPSKQSWLDPGTEPKVNSEPLPEDTVEKWTLTKEVSILKTKLSAIINQTPTYKNKQAKIET